MPIEVPSLLIQTAAQRTASTLQFQVLCATLVLLRQDREEPVTCQAALTKFEHNVERYGSESKAGRGRLLLRSHRMLDAQTASKLLPAPWVFTTSHRDGTVATHLDEGPLGPWWNGGTLKYIQNFTKVTRARDRVVADYAPIFGLSSEDSRRLHEYIKNWDVLRICCGSELSEEYRAVLHHDPKGESNKRTPRFCLAQDLAARERALMATEVYRLGSDIPNIGRVSGFYTTDDVFEGHHGFYCVCANEHIQTRRLTFHQAVDKAEVSRCAEARHARGAAALVPTIEAALRLGPQPARGAS